MLGVAPLPDRAHERDTEGGDRRIDGGTGRLAVLRIEAREDLVIAQQSLDLLDATRSSGA